MLCGSCAYSVLHCHTVSIQMQGGSLQAAAELQAGVHLQILTVTVPGPRSTGNGPRSTGPHLLASWNITHHTADYKL